jgi:hypothetical protein
MLPVTPEVEAALNSASFNIAVLVDLPSSGSVNLRLTDNARAITYGGQVYTPGGVQLMSVDPVRRGMEITSDSLQVTVDNISGDAYQDYVVNNHVGKAARVYVAFLNTSGALLSAGSVLQIYEGLVDSWSIEESGSESALLIRLTSHWSAFKVANSRFTNSASQNEVYPGDTFFDFSHQEELPVKWGI